MVRVERGFAGNFIGWSEVSYQVSGIQDLIFEAQLSGNLTGQCQGDGFAEFSRARFRGTADLVA